MDMDSSCPSRPRLLVTVERLADALAMLGYNPSKDIRYPEFLLEHTANESNDGPSDQLDFEHFALVVLEYEEQLRVETEALRRLDLKVAFEYFDMNKGRGIRRSHRDRLAVFVDGMIDAEELSTIMMQLGCSINDREAKDMIDFADQDTGIPSLVDWHISLSLSVDSLVSFNEFLTVLVQISAMSTS